MAPLVLLLLAADPRLVNDQVEAGVAVQSLAPTGQATDAVVAPFVTGRGHLGGASGELTVLGSAPVLGHTAGSVTFAPRVGWSGRSWSLLLGAAIQVAPATPAPAQVLPSVRFDKRFGEAGFSLGLFDFAGLLPAHLSVETEHFSLGYVAPVGVRASLRFGLGWPGWSLELQGFGYRLFQSEVAMAALTVRFGGSP